MMTRRKVIVGGAVGLGAWFAFPWAVSRSGADETYEVMHSEAEWHRLLTADQYAVLRQSATERPFTSPLLREARPGTYACAGCGLDLFSSETKYDPGEGWPSFWKPLDEAVGTRRDTSFGMVRTEVHCRRCGGHLGHLFDDGPRPTGLRYCMDGLAMIFRPAAA
jgi:peptide-methionine (R)-S-oxide reductase